MVAESGELIRWIATTRAVRRTASVCSGTFLLAEAGLLDGRRAATHWAMCDRLGTLFLSIEVDNDAIFVEQDNVWTSAGVSAGIDLALPLVEADCGCEVAMQVALNAACRKICCPPPPVSSRKLPAGHARYLPKTDPPSALVEIQSGFGKQLIQPISRSPQRSSFSENGRCERMC